MVGPHLRDRPTHRPVRTRKPQRLQLVEGPVGADLVVRGRGRCWRRSLTDVSAHGMRFMAFGEMDVGLAPVWCGRISFTRDLGYELWMPARYQRYVFDLLRSAGGAHGLSCSGCTP